MIQKKNLHAAIWYAALSLFVLLFGRIYTHYSHGAHSNGMTYAFVPLQIAAFVYLILAIFEKIPRPQSFSSLFIAFAVTAFTLDSITEGVLEIAGAYSNYDVLIHYAGIVCIALAAILYLIEILLPLFKNKIHAQ